MISKARERLKDKFVCFSTFDAEDGIKGKTKFKTIIGCNLFFYLTSPGDAVQNWKNILQDDGVIIPTNDENISDFSNRHVQVHHACTPKEILKTFEANGFYLLMEPEEKIDSRHSLHGAAFKVKSVTESGP